MNYSLRAKRLLRPVCRPRIRLPKPRRPMLAGKVAKPGRGKDRLSRAPVASGTPVQAYGRTFTPIVRMMSLVQHHATIRESGYEGAGWGGVWVKPLAVVEQDGGQAHTMLIPNVTATVLREMAIVALALPLFCLAVISLARWVRDR